MAALRPDEIDAYRKWINDQFGWDRNMYDQSGSPVTTAQLMANPGMTVDERLEANPWQFDNGDFTGDDRTLNYDLLGAARHMGIDDAGIAQILGLQPDQVTSYRQSTPDVFIDMASQVFAKDNPMSPQGLHSAGSTGTPSAAPDWQSMQPWSTPGQTTGSGGYMPNPYLGSMADDITRRVNTNLTEEILPGIRGSFRGMGGAGGSRQGLAEGKAISGSMDALSGQLASLFGGAYETDANRGLQQQQISNSYDLGLGNLGLGWGQLGANYSLGREGLGNQRLGMNQNFYLGNRQQDTTDALAGSNIYSQGLRDSWYGPLAYGGLLNGLAGTFGSSTTNNDSGGGGLWGGMSGLLSGAQFGKNMGWY